MRWYLSVPLVAAAVLPSCAAAMSSSGRCSVIAGEKLPAASGGSIAICSEIERAIASAAPGVHYSAEVKVLSPSRLSASLVVNGRALPEQNFAIMDRQLDRAAVQRFARSLAAELSKATKL
jgi:hypothetical protein